MQYEVDVRIIVEADYKEDAKIAVCSLLDEEMANGNHSRIVDYDLDS